MKIRLVDGQPNVNSLAPRISASAGSKASISRTKSPSQGNPLRAVEFSPNTGGGNPITTMAFGSPAYGNLLQGMVPDESPTSYIPHLRDIYYNDPIGGSTVDINSTFPYSDYSLTGLDKHELDVYGESMSRINMRTLMSSITLGHQVDGAFIGTLIFNPQYKNFQDILVHDTASAQVNLQGLHIVDPLITVGSSAALNQLINSDSPYKNNILAGYPEALLRNYTSGTLHLDPLTTLYIPRKSVPSVPFNSYLRRLLPIYLFEKLMYRGTLMEAYKRQRSTTHIMAGNDNWIPTEEELIGLLSEAQRTELDPMGGWIVTREGVQFNEIRSPNDVWKWTDVHETLTPMKLRALGVSEAFLSGDACLSGNTLIPTSYGLVKIKDIAGIVEPAQNRIYNLRELVVSRRGGPGYSKAWIYNGKKPCLRITTDSQNYLECTENHQLLTLRMGVIDWIRADEVTTDDYLISPNKSTAFRYAHSNIYYKLYTEFENGSTQIRSEAFIMTLNVAKALALIAAQGSICKDGNLLVRGLSEEECLIVSTTLSRITRVYPEIIEDNQIFSVQLTNKSALATLNALVPLGTEEQVFMEVPRCILQSSQKLQSVFLDVLDDAQEYMTEYFKQGIRSMKNSWQPRSYLGTETKYWKDTFGIDIDIEYASESLVGRNPELGRMIASLPEEARGSFLEAIKGNYKFTRITNIEDAGVQDVYDLCMAGDPSFVANGLIVHNSYSTAESAITTFTESMNALRQQLTHRTFTSKLFPLIAVLNNMYRDPSRANLNSDNSMAALQSNLSNTFNLKIPTIQWHKSLDNTQADTQMDMLEKLSDKGFVIPLRMWASAAGLDLSALIRDLEEDQRIRKLIENVTGKRAETIGNEDKKGFDEDAFLPESTGSAPEEGEVAASLTRLSAPISKIPLLARDFSNLDIPRNGKMSRSGKVLHAQYGDTRQDKKANDKIYKALKALKDPAVYKAALERARNSGIRFDNLN